MKHFTGMGLAIAFLLVAAMVATAQTPETTPKDPTKAAGSGPRMGEAFRSLPPEVKEALPEQIKQRIAQRMDRAKLGREKGFALLHADGVGMDREGKKVDLRIQTGVIEDVSSTSMRLKSQDGYTQTYGIDDNTNVRGKGKPDSASDLKAQDMARVMAVKQGDRYIARTIHSRGASGPKLTEGPGTP